MKNKTPTTPPSAAKTMRLNKFISHAGICSRREADTLIQAGHITVNGQQVTTLGYQVTPRDVVKYRNKPLSAERLQYVLLNKPKNCITTAKDPQERQTVLHLTRNACPERIYPVGRLDRNTTGLLLLTNDGALATKLSHPASKVKKLYHVTLDRPLASKDFDQLQAGVQLEDGVAHIDELAIATQDRTSVGLVIHMGRNRIIRRLFEHLNYAVEKLDRVLYAHLTKKELPRGQ
ncbi:MAG: pseudouridine synthase, partial [Bacteroidota bacterium]